MNDILASGSALQAAGRYAEAVDLYRRALQAAPDHPGLLCDCGAALTQLDEAEAALALLERAADLAREDPRPPFQLGRALRKAGRLDDAAAALQRATELVPRFTGAWLELGALARFRQDWATAEAALATARNLAPQDPRVLHELAQLKLGAGAWAEGFALYEARRRISRGAPQQQTSLAGAQPWRGERLAGKRIAVIGEQGFGDQIQFARYVPALVARGAEVTLACAGPLTSLFAGVGGVSVMPISLVSALPPCDFWCPIMSLPHALGAAEPTGDPYVEVPQDRLERWRDALPAGGVGFVWRGNPRLANDANRSLPSPDLLAPLGEAAQLVDLQEPVGDFADTAARIRPLSLVVAVDTSMVHLCGALGVPCWVMLPHLGLDWRWGRSGAATPWYRSVRLFRQARPGDWSSVVAEMKSALASMRR